MATARKGALRWRRYTNYDACTAELMEVSNTIKDVLKTIEAQSNVMEAITASKKSCVATWSGGTILSEDYRASESRLHLAHNSYHPRLKSSKKISVQEL